MLEIDKNIVELLKKGATFSKLKTKTGLCSSDVVKKVHSLENKGYLIHKVFNEYGVKFQIISEPVMPLQDKIEIKTSNNFSFLVISDTHSGNIYEDMEKVHRVYNYAEENNYRYVVHLGDMLEGVTLPNQNNDRVKREGIHEQIDFLTKNYPKSDKVETIYILGNHDYRCFSEGVDISRVIDNRRLDMHFAGYKNSKIKIGNRDILLHHPFNINRDNKYDEEIRDLYINSDFDLVLRGHTHHNGLYINEMGSIVICVPACYSSPSRDYTGAYGITLKEKEVEIDSLFITNEVSLFSVIKQPLKEKEKVKTINNQIDKFNARNRKK